MIFTPFALKDDILAVGFKIPFITRFKLVVVFSVRSKFKTSAF
jgi:hypothetical protein